MQRPFFLLTALLLWAHGRPVAGHVPGLDQDLAELSQQVSAGEIQAQRDASDPAAHARLIAAYLSRARLSGDWSDVDRAEEALARARAFAPERAELLWAEAALRAYQHRFRASLRAARRLIQAEPAEARGYGAAGDALLELGQIERAAAQYAQMARLQRDFDALVRLGRIRQVQGRPDRAAALFQEAIDTAQREGESGRRDWARIALASLEMEQGRLERAATLLDQVLQEQPSDFLALKHLAELCVLAGQDERADEFYARAFSIRPDLSCAAAWAEVQRRLGKTAAADTLDRVAEQALRTYVSTGRTAYLRELATLYLRRDQNPAEALRLAVQDLAIRQDTRAFEILAWAYQKNRMHAEAQAAIQKALARPDANARTWYLAGGIALDLGEVEAARQWRTRALQVHPRCPEAREARARLGVL